MSPFRHSWFTRSSLDVPELIQAIAPMLLVPLPAAWNTGVFPNATLMLLLLLLLPRVGVAARKKRRACRENEGATTETAVA